MSNSYSHNKYDTVGETTIRYWNQAIPSPLGLAKYDEAFNPKHDIENDMFLDFDNFKYMPRFDNTVHFSGVSCFKYLELISVADTLHCLRKYLTGYDVKTGSFKYPKFLTKTFKSDKRQKITTRIHAIRDLFITNVSDRFQQNNVKLWNPESKLSTQIIVPPVTPYDEVTNNGMETFLVHLLELSGIFSKNRKTQG